MDRKKHYRISIRYPTGEAAIVDNLDAAAELLGISKPAVCNMIYRPGRRLYAPIVEYTTDEVVPNRKPRRGKGYLLTNDESEIFFEYAAEGVPIIKKMYKDHGLPELSDNTIMMLITRRLRLKIPGWRIEVANAGTNNKHS